jgi:hypothetical protein
MEESLMASTKTVTRETKKTTCKPKTCPSCGSRECFTRPRFFCGQMLMAEVLEESQRYVIEKNKLHNRYLVGTGVVCGMAVRCDPCDGAVTVEPGYAIDCCGNDIVVCEPQRFDVLRYLKDCFRDDEPGCDGKITQPPPSPCDDLPREYCLVISYNEIHTRPMAAMMRQNGCSTTSCEPSQTNEVFRLDLVEEGERDARAAGDDFLGHVRECFTEHLAASKRFFAELNQSKGMQDAQQRQNALKAAFCHLRDDVLRLYRKGPRVRCALPEQLREIEESFPWVTEVPQYDALVYNALFRLYGWLVQSMLDCVCDALLVPCRPCGDEAGVRLACLTVRGGRVEKICNLARRQVLTGPSLRYWLAPLFAGVGRLVEHLCCDLKLADSFDRVFRPRGEATVTTGEDQEPWDAAANSVEHTVLRTESLMRLLGDYASAGIAGAGLLDVLRQSSPQTYTALDVYGLTTTEARAKLESRGFNVYERQATQGEAYSLGNLFAMSWVVPSQKGVELVVGPEGRVTAVRVHEGN